MRAEKTANSNRVDCFQTSAMIEIQKRQQELRTVLKVAIELRTDFIGNNHSLLARGVGYEGSYFNYIVQTLYNMRKVWLNLQLQDYYNRSVQIR